MAKLVVLELGKGDFNQEVDVILEIGEEQSRQSIRIKGALPPAPDIAQHYQLWQSTYRSLDVRRRIKIKPAQTTNISIKDSLKDCANSADFFKSSLLGWYKSDKFSSIREKLFQEIDKSAEVRLIIQTQNHQLRRLPWHLFFESFLDVYRHAEVALSPPEYQRVEKATLGTVRTKVRILAILGNSAGIDIAEDRKLLENLPDAEVVFLVEPQRQQVDELLWDEKGWDILFFAGHSSSRGDGETGLIYINQTDSLTIADLKNGLKKAIEQGLQLAIFNSCDGLGLANDLASLHIPQIIVMREPVPDRVAQTFLKHFLTAFSRGISLYAAVREARERLQALEDEFPYATWLPIICQNPTEVSMNWKKREINWREICHKMLIANQRVTTNPLTANDGMTFEIDEIYVPLGLVERKKLPKRKDEDSPQQGSKLYAPDEYEVTRKYQHEEFFEQVLRNKESDKSQGKRLGITGEPGAGKTTQLQKIGDWILRETNDDLVIWVSLADLQELSLEEYLRQTWLKNALGVARVTPEMEDELVRVFQSGKVWLLLDGVDEMAVPNPLQNIAFQIRGWIAPARVVLTCRQNVWDAGKNALENFDVYRNLDFNLEQVNRFIDKWFTNNREAGKRLKVELGKSGKERIRDAVRNPLRLALLCRSWQQREGALPETKAELYRQFTEALYEWKEESFPTTSAQRRELEAALGRLGLQAISGSSSRFRLTNRQVCEVLGAADTPLFQLAMQLGWLNQVGVAAENPSEKVYAFYHPTFEEYFAALAIDDWHFFLNHVSHNPQEGNYRIFEKQWKEVILLWLGREDIRNEQKEGFIKALREFQDGCCGFYGYRAFFMAASGIAEFANCEYADEILKQLVKWSLATYDDPLTGEYLFWSDPVADAATTALQETNGKMAIAFLKKFYNSKQDENIGWQVAQIVTMLAPGNSQAIQLLTEMMSPNNSALTRCHAALGLVKVDSSNLDAIKILSELLKNSKDAEIIYIVMDQLEQIGVDNLDIIQALIDLEKSENEDICVTAWTKLLHLNPSNPEAIAALADWRQSKNLKSRKKTNKSSENAFQRSSKETAQNSEDIIDNLIEILNNDEGFNGFDEIMTVQKLGEVASGTGNQNAVAALTNLLNSSDDYNIRRLAAIYVWKIHSNKSEAIQTLTKLLNGSDDEIRLEAAKSLCKIDEGNLDCIQTLTDLLNSSNLDICYHAATNLWEINPGNEEVIYTLIDLVYLNDDRKKSSAPFPRDMAAEKLNKILTGDWFSVVVAELKDCQHDAAFEVIWHCAQNMTYPEFYQVWHYYPTTIHPEATDNIPATFSSSFQFLENQIANISSQLQSTTQTYPLYIDAQALVEETDTATLAQEICTQIYLAASLDSEFPEEIVNSAAQLKTKIIQVKNCLQKQHLALIFHNCQPHAELVNFCRKLLPGLNNFLHIAWITDVPIEPPLRGFPPNQPNLSSVMQSWIDEIE
ncbi:MAG: HEAT repeat domain-containing protein [Phormidium sp.]